MSQEQPGIRMARELTLRLESAFGSKAVILCGSPGCWSARRIEQRVRVVDPLMDAPLRAFDTASNRPLVMRCDGQLVAVVKTGDDYEETIVVAIVLPDQNDTVAKSLISAHLEALQNQHLAEAAQSQVESFIDQVTQDFEELTWLRNTFEYLDVCDSNQTLESIARKCLPDLAHVIRAESILFVPSKPIADQEADHPNWDCMIAAGSPLSNTTVCHQFLTDSLHSTVRGPNVVNVAFSQKHLPAYPGLRNGIAIALSKANRVYGWILAINRIPSEVEASLMAVEKSQAIAPSFGTFEAGLLAAAAGIMSSHARNLELFEAQEALTTGVVRAIINAIDAKDPYTCGHSDRVALYAKRIATRMALEPDECERIYMAGLLHDVGKIGIPDSILGKPGKLTDEEYAIVKKHPEMGHSILKHLTQLRYVLPGVLHHHEAVNGKGYPAGLMGEAIPLHGRILAVADAYDAMTSDRPYRVGMPSEKAEAIMRSESGKTWDPDIVMVLLECLANGEIQPHAAESDGDSSGTSTVSNTNLMERIRSSINSLTPG